MEIYAFIVLAVLTIATALGMILNKNTVNSALFLVLHLIALAGVYLLLRAQFLAIVQVIVYAGAIMVLFLFVIMLLNVSDEEKFLDKFRIGYFVAFLLGVLMVGQVVYSVAGVAGLLPSISAEMATIGTVEAVGDVLFTDYLMPFEMTAILLTAAVVGALMIAQFKSPKADTRS